MSCCAVVLCADTTNPVLDWVMDAAGDVQQWAVEQGVVALQSAHAVLKVRCVHFGNPCLSELTELGAWGGTRAGQPVVQNTLAASSNHSADWM
mgnify:CR=1 FL=1